MLALVCATSGAAHAQSAPTTTGVTARSPSEVALARAEFQAGVQAGREGRWTDALSRYTRAYQLVPQPQILLNLAGAQLRVGRLVAAAESYRRFLREVPAGSGPLAVHRTAARAALAHIEPQIAHVTFAVAAGGALTSNEQVTFDGEPLSSAVVGAALPVDPGAHVLAVLRAGSEVARARVEVEAGASREVALTIPPPPSETAATRPVEVTLGASGAGNAGGNGGAGAGSGAGGAGGASGEGSAAAGNGGRAIAGLGGASRAGNGTPHPEQGRATTGAGQRGGGGARRGGSVLASPWFWTGVVLVVGAGATAITLWQTGVFDPPRVEPPVAGNVPPFVIMAP